LIDDVNIKEAVSKVERAFFMDLSFWRGFIQKAAV
jgi:hypothetical protein